MKLIVAFPLPGTLFILAPKTTVAVADCALTIAQLCSVVGIVFMSVRVTLELTLTVSAGPGDCMVVEVFPNPNCPPLVLPA